MTDLRDPLGDDQEAATREIRDFFVRRGRTQRWGRGREQHAQERWEMLEHIASGLRRDLRLLRVLDVGCGAGDDLARWRGAGVDPRHLAGTELITERAIAATKRLPGASIKVVDGVLLPFPDNSFDLVTASLVFSLIRDTAVRHKLFEEMRRVARVGGRLAVYDFVVRKPTNRNVVAMTRRRATQLGSPPDRSWAAGRFLPALPAVLLLPLPLRSLAIRALPRTHALYLWHV